MLQEGTACFREPSITEEAEKVGGRPVAAGNEERDCHLFFSKGTNAEELGSDKQKEGQGLHWQRKAAR